MTCECQLDAIGFLTQKLKKWTVNSPLVETILLDMFKEPFGPHWLGHVLSFLRDHVGLSLEMSSFEAFRSAFLTIDRATFRDRITSSCHRICVPPSSSRTSLYADLDLSSAASWFCFSSTNRHYRLSRIFASDSFRFSRALTSVDSDQNCEACHTPATLEHWFCCPLRSDDRDLFFQATNFPLSHPRDLRRVLCNKSLTVALEFALSKTFK
jgi:hypothetical protein